MYKKLRIDKNIPILWLLVIICQYRQLLVTNCKLSVSKASLSLKVWMRIDTPTMESTPATFPTSISTEYILAE